MSRRGLVSASALLVALLGHGNGPDPATLLAEGDALRRKEAYRSAQVRVDDALSQARAAGDRAVECDALSARARIADGLGDPAEAARWRDQALALSRSEQDARCELRVISDAGAGHWQRAEYDDAQRALRSALDGQRQRGDREGEAITLGRLGRVAFKQGRYDAALELYTQALAVARAAGTSSTEIGIQIDIGSVWLDRRAHTSALEAFELGLALADRSGDVELQVLALNQIGISYLFQNAPDEARARFETALARARTARDLPLEMKVQHLLANALRLGGAHHEAIAIYTRCAAYDESEGNDREAAWNDARRGRAEAALGRLSDAERSFSRAIATWERIHERRPLAYALFERGRLQVTAGRDAEARDTFARALALQRQIDLPYDPLLLSELAQLELRRGDVARAQRLSGEAVARAEAIENPELLWTALHSAARIERGAGHHAAAWPQLLRALEVIETMFDQTAPSDEAKAGFLADKQAVYAEAVDLAFSLGHLAEALSISERARARAFLDLLASTPARAPQLTFRSHPPPLVPSEASVAPATLSEMRDAARRRDATILAYFTTAARSFVFVVTARGALRAAAIPIDATTLRRQVAATRRAIEQADHSAAALLTSLHTQLVAPILDALPRDPDRLVLVVPHGPLALLPFACLRDAAGSYLIERHTLAQLPALAILRRPPTPTAPSAITPKRLLAVGNPLAAAPLQPLPGAEAEARSVAALFPPHSASLLFGPAATEAQLRALAPTATTLHLATHALIREDAPLASYLALTPGARTRTDRDGDRDDDDNDPDRNDGRLTALEVLRLPLSATLVTLSGCDTGGGMQGEGIGSFTRAFLHAGARTVVVSLWRVADDPGRDQMIRYYRSLRTDKLPPARALRRAQLGTLDALRRGALRDERGARLPESPLYWAPFVLIGEPG